MQTLVSLSHTQSLMIYSQIIPYSHILFFVVRHAPAILFDTKNLYYAHKIVVLEQLMIQSYLIQMSILIDSLTKYQFFIKYLLLNYQKNDFNIFIVTIRLIIFFLALSQSSSKNSLLKMLTLITVFFEDNHTIDINNLKM